MLNTNKKICTGCAACVSVCPVKIIKLEDGDCGYKYPVVQEDKCINCNKCNLICPTNNTKNLIISQRCYAAYTLNRKELLKRTSGGVATEFANYFLNRGQIVYGVTYSQDYKSAKHTRVDKKEDLFNIVGTKYVQAEKGNVYEQVVNDLDNNRKVLFIGLPCEIAAVYNYVKNNRDNLLLCELVCHGPASPKTLREYVEYLENRYKTKISYLNVRYKKNGWETPYLKATFRSKEEYLKEFYSTEYGEAFYLQGRTSCYECAFKGNQSKADITIGDYWGISEEDEMYNKEGVSICFCHSEKAERVLLELKNLKCQAIKFEDAIKNNDDVIKSRLIHDKTEKFTRIYKTNGLIKSLFLIKSPVQKVKYLVKIILKRK